MKFKENLGYKIYIIQGYNNFNKIIIIIIIIILIIIIKEEFQRILGFLI